MRDRVGIELHKCITKVECLLQQSHDAFYDIIFSCSDRNFPDRTQETATGIADLRQYSEQKLECLLQVMMSFMIAVQCTHYF